MKKGANIILVIGESGAGKSSSLRNMKGTETVLIKPNPNALPFPGWTKEFIKGKNLFITDKMSDVKKILTAEQLRKYKYFVVDDLNLYFNARTTSPSFIAQNSGNAAFAKWNTFAADVIQNFFVPAQNLPDGSYLIIMAHTELKDDGKIGIKTSGKLLDSNLKMQSYATYVFHALTLEADKDVTYKFLTNTDGTHEAKSPAGCFDKYISNDLKVALDRIDAYNRGEVKDIVWK